MIKNSIENRITALNPKAKKLLLIKLKDAVTRRKEENSASKRIVAYVKGGKDFSIDELKTNLQKKLPDYMVPAQFISVAAIPLLPNGKINRDKIERLEIEEAPIEKSTTNNIEQQLIKIWEEVLGFSPIHKKDNFFEIGGDSILSIQIIAKAKKEGFVLQANDLFEHQTISELSNIVQVAQEKDTTSEDILLKIWEEVLGFSPIHKDDNFFEIGGDSILSIQIIAKARKEGLVLQANQLFEHQTVAELSKIVKAPTKVKESELVTGIVPLSPIQEWFFNDHENAPQFWNQAIRFDNLPSTSENEIAKVCEYLITQHDILRSSYRNINNKWIQEIKSPEQIFAIEYIDLSIIEEELHKKVVAEKTKDIQSKFDLSKGSLFKCIYFKSKKSSKDFCILIAHHLVVDAVSWQIITDDFNSALQEVTANKTISKETKTNSFKEWTEHIINYTENISEEELTFWENQITKVPALPVDLENHTIIEEKEIAQLHFSFNEEITKTLLEANKTYNTKTEELLITAFINAIGNWSKNPEIAIGFERHGRETTASELDVSKTVGWFTSYFPLKFAFQPNNKIDDKIIAIKEKIRSIPNGGIGYGGLRYLKNVFDEVQNPEIVFNFLGSQTNFKSKNTTKTTWLTNNLRDPKSERHYKLEVNLSITDNELKGAVSFGANIHKKETITALIDDFKKQIEEINTHCSQIEKGRYTPSDFSDAGISQDDLDNLIDFLD